MEAHETDVDAEVPRRELADARREAQQQRDANDALRHAVDSGEAARRQLIESQAAERARWMEDRKLLQERARDNEEQAANLARKVRAVVEAQRDVVEQHALEKARLEDEANEARQQLTELRAVHASLLATISQRLETFERDRAEWQAEQHRVSADLEAAERSCTEQQDLLYRVRQQMASVFSLLDGSPQLLGPRPVVRQLEAVELPESSKPSQDESDTHADKTAAIA
jgi:chromosome segregation ATPase